MSRVAELKAALAKKVADINRFTANGIKIDENHDVEVKSEDATAVKKLFAEASEIKQLIEIEQFGVDTKAWIEGGDSSKAVEAEAMARMAYSLGQGGGTKSIGQRFIESAEFKSLLDSGQLKMPKAWELGGVGDLTYGARERMEKKDIYGSLNAQTIPAGVGTVIQFDPLVPRGQRPTRVRDLFPVAQTAANLIEFFRVMGWVENGGDGNAQMVPDYSGGVFGTKPKSNLDFQPDSAPVRTLAHWEAAHRNVLQDAPQLQSTINNELLYGLALVEDFQILRGDGTGENLKGILNTEGIQLYTAPNNEIKSDSLRRASTLATLANYPATGYVLHPNDWESIELQKGSGDGQYMLFTNIAIGAAAMVWRQPVVETPAMPETVFLTGAFGTGAQLYDRMQASIRISDQHANFFVQNAVAILAEERLALAVKRPESFIKGQFDT